MSIPIRCFREESIEDSKDFDVGELYDSLLDAEDKKPWSRTVGVYHPSSLGQCKRANYYDRIGVPPTKNVSKDLKQRFEVGHAVHEWFQRRLKNDPDFECEVVARVDGLFIEGSCDGVFRHRNWVLEIKTISDGDYKRLVRAKKEHILQVHCYMAAFDIPRAQIMYINKNSGARRVFRIKFSNELWDEVVELITDLEMCVETETPPPQEISKYNCPNCKFVTHCKPDLT